MTESDKQILRSYPRKNISLGVTKDGLGRSIHVPWQLGCNAYNMRTPDLWLSPAELPDGELWEELGRLRVIGMYIFCPLEDYGFLDRLTELQDIAIYKGGNLRSLSFLRRNPDWFMLHIADAVLPDLTDLIPAAPMRRNVCLSGCTVVDISALEEVNLSELLILMPGKSNDRARWQRIKCSKFGYFEYRV